MLRARARTAGAAESLLVMADVGIQLDTTYEDVLMFGRSGRRQSRFVDIEHIQARELFSRPSVSPLLCVAVAFLGCCLQSRAAASATSRRASRFQGARCSHSSWCHAMGSSAAFAAEAMPPVVAPRARNHSVRARACFSAGCHSQRGHLAPAHVTGLLCPPVHCDGVSSRAWVCAARCIERVSPPAP